MVVKPKTILIFFLLLFSSIFFVYYLPGAIGSAWLFGMLILYWFSKDEAFWLAFFLVISDGFISFFGSSQAVVNVLPGMPAIEIEQLYILLTVMKGLLRETTYPLFYKKYIRLLGIYALILLLLGIAIGIEADIKNYFKILKGIIPLFLFYSIPKLMRNKEDYTKLFGLLFIMAIMAFASQIFEIITRAPLSSYFIANEQVEFVDEDLNRTLYNPLIILLSMFGSLFFLTEKEHKFNQIYINVVMVLSFSMGFLSAARGWTIGNSITLILYVLFIVGFNFRRLIVIISLGVVLFFLAMSLPVLNKQITDSYDRILTVEKIGQGGEAVGEIRTTERGPRVMKKWRESPIVGFGYSSEGGKYSDGHVGNQNLLMGSGIIGLVLLYSFFLFFNAKLLSVYMLTSDKSFLTFIFFFIGWFIIHSTSGQQFSYGGAPGRLMTEAIFFSFGAFCVAESNGNIINLKNS
jgi:hypothetical protein